MAMSPYRFTDGNSLVGRPASSFLRLFAFAVDAPDLPPREPISPVPHDPPVSPRHEPPPSRPVNPSDPPIPANPPNVPQPIGQWLMANSKKGLANSFRLMRREVLIHAR